MYSIQLHFASMTLRVVECRMVRYVLVMKKYGNPALSTLSYIAVDGMGERKRPSRNSQRKQSS